MSNGYKYPSDNIEWKWIRLALCIRFACQMLTLRSRDGSKDGQARALLPPLGPFAYVYIYIYKKNIKIKIINKNIYEKYVWVDICLNF